MQNIYFLSMLLSTPVTSSRKIKLHIRRVKYEDYVDLLAGVTAKILKEYGAIHGRSQQVLRLFNKFCDNKSDFRCHCIAKHPHYCAIGEVLKYLPITCP
jgi:hypothetical protein